MGTIGHYVGTIYTYWQIFGYNDVYFIYVLGSS